MKYKKAISILLLFLFMAGCGPEKRKFDNKFYKTEALQWEQYLKDIGIKNPNLTNSVYLFVHTSSCVPCLKELTWWNNHANDFQNINVKLIVIEQFKNTFEAFLKTNNITLKAHQDTKAWALENELIPYPPVKIFFHEESKIAVIEEVGTGGNLGTFLAKIQK
ncbi:MAG TPA: hypothetical protein VK106_05625 [Balneolaceae bacterium]|nr:hypothetical protein [Balneolaceae bacterium]